MKNTLILDLYGYTVRGIDFRDRCPFEDHIVISNLNGSISQKRIDYIQEHYHSLDFMVGKEDIIPDKDDNCVSISLDLNQLYLEQLKALEEQQDISSSEEL